MTKSATAAKRPAAVPEESRPGPTRMDPRDAGRPQLKMNFVCSYAFAERVDRVVKMMKRADDSVSRGSVLRNAAEKEVRRLEAKLGISGPRSA